MGYYSGNSGSIQFGLASTVDPDEDTGWVTTPTNLTEWTLNPSQALLDTTTLGEYDKSSVYGLRTTSGTLRLFYYTEPEQPKQTPQTICQLVHQKIQRNAIGADTPDSIKVFLRLYIDDKDMSADVGLRDFVEFEANLTSVSYGSRVGELVAVDVSFEATGSLHRVYV